MALDFLKNFKSRSDNDNQKSDDGLKQVNNIAQQMGQPQGDDDVKSVDDLSPEQVQKMMDDSVEELGLKDKPEEEKVDILNKLGEATILKLLTKAYQELQPEQVEELKGKMNEDVNYNFFSYLGDKLSNMDDLLKQASDEVKASYKAKLAN